ncbi:MAG: proline dehydrogenase family protein [Bacteroidota bacterium]
MSTSPLPPKTTLDFENTELAFRARSDQRLKRDFWLFKMVDSPFLTKVGPPMLTFAMRAGLPVTGLVRNTLFNLFCGGESLTETVGRSSILDKFRVKTILDYSVEGEKTESAFDATLNEFIATLRQGARQSSIAMVACKLTALAPFDLLAKLQAGGELKEGERSAYNRVKRRIHDLAKAAADHRTPIYIDAEESWIQDTIDRLTEELMEQYNQKSVVVYHTVQLYRHDRLDYLRQLIQRSQQKGYKLGVKLVRGAYMEKERERAVDMGYPSPIQPDKQATDADYNTAVDLCVDHLEHVSVCVGSHNEESCRRLAERMNQMGLPHDHPNVWFAQLLSMSDHITFNLAAQGFNAAKYLPYGPVKAVMPYLIRRANENTAIAGQASREMQLLTTEMERRGLK